MSEKTKRIGKGAIIACAILVMIVSAYAVNYHNELSYFFSVKNDVTIGEYTIQMKAGWVPYGKNSQLQTATFARGGIFPFIAPGNIHFQFLKDVDQNILREVETNSDVYKKYQWGIALALKESFFDETLKIKNISPRRIYYVPELNVLIDVLHAEDIDDIKMIYKNNTHLVEKN